MKIHIKYVFLILFFSVGIFLARKASALVDLPIVTTACELKNGQLHAMDDGFSMFKQCEGESRRVVLVGERGLQGEKGEKGDPGIQGIPGEKGETGIVDTQLFEELNHEILFLNERIDQLESNTAPLSKTISLFNNHAIPQTSEWIDASGYTNIAFLAQTDAAASQVIIQITNDTSQVTNNTGFTDYYWSSCASYGCTPISLPVEAKYYRYKITSGQSGNITCSAYLSR